ncbi:MAG TPA: hypothetical protein VKV28_07145 [Candidatus Binataceae bacterium]|nr:hypothetical protein [Candidatus Binataceae bacterium]
MQGSSAHHETPGERTDAPGIVYRVSCENPGCNHIFDLRITAKDAGLLGGTLACPHCRRHGGILKPTGRLERKIFTARLTFKLTGSSSGAPGEEGDLLTDIS